MKRKGAVLAAVIFIAAGFPAWAQAGGWGPYFSWGRDEPSTDLVYSLLRANVDLKIDHITFGLLYDSAPSRDQLFSYRFALGFDVATKVDFKDIDVKTPISLSDLSGQLDEDGYGFSMNHTFAFALVRNSLLKWWIGPGLRLNFNYYDVDVPPGLPDKAANLVIGGGGETGLNVHVTPNMSVCLAGGIHYNAFGYVVDTDVDLGSLDWGDGPFYFIQVGALFHTGKDRNAWAASQAVP